MAKKPRDTVQNAPVSIPITITEQSPMDRVYALEAQVKKQSEAIAALELKWAKHFGA